MSIPGAVSMFASYALAGRFDSIAYKVRTKRLGLDLGFVPVEDLGLTDGRAHWYSDSGGPDLIRVLKALKIPKGTRAIDIGSGKGGAVITLAEYLDCEVVGLELSESLIEIAEENARRAGVSARFVCGDAAVARDLSAFDLIYMYNPFPATIMEAFMVNVLASLRTKPRKLTIIYKNPTAHEIVASTVKHVGDYTFPKCHHAFAVYQN